MVGVRYTAIHRADLNALGCVKVAYSLGALIGVNYIDFLTLGDGLIGTLRLTSSTANTLFGNLVRHLLNLSS